MKAHATWLCAAALLAASGPLGAAQASYRFDPQRTFVHFEVLHFGTSTIRGRFGPVDGEVLLDREAGRGEVRLRVATAGVSTGLAVFDARLREADLLASAEHPEAYFVATRLRFEGGQPVELRGEFTLRGVSQPLTLRALRFACRSEGDGPTPAEVCGGDFEGEFKRSSFGATFGLPFVGDSVRLQVQVEARRR